jgi:hypothetical protein
VGPRSRRHALPPNSFGDGRNSVNSQSAKGNSLKTEKPFATHIAPEFLKIAELISNKFGKSVYLIGIRAVYEQGIKPWRVTEDYDIYSPLTKNERDELSEEIKKRFGGSYQWTSFGIIYRVGEEEIDINLANPIRDEDIKERARRVSGNIYALSIEDLIIMKLTSTRRKDRVDVGKILRNAESKYDTKLLLAESDKAGVTKDLLKVAKRYGIKLP